MNQNRKYKEKVKKKEKEKEKQLVSQSPDTIIPDLPVEIWYNIFQYGPDVYLKGRKISKFFRDIINHIINREICSFSVPISLREIINYIIEIKPKFFALVEYPPQFKQNENYSEATAYLFSYEFMKMYIFDNDIEKYFHIRNKSPDHLYNVPNYQLVTHDLLIAGDLENNYNYNYNYSNAGVKYIENDYYVRGERAAYSGAFEEIYEEVETFKIVDPYQILEIYYDSKNLRLDLLTEFEILKRRLICNDLNKNYANQRVLNHIDTFQKDYEDNLQKYPNNMYVALRALYYLGPTAISLGGPVKKLWLNSTENLLSTDPQGSIDLIYRPDINWEEHIPTPKEISNNVHKIIDLIREYFIIKI